MSLEFSNIIVNPVGPCGKTLILCGPTYTSYQGFPIDPRAYEVAPGIKFPPNTMFPSEGSILISPVDPVTPEIVLFCIEIFPTETIPDVDPSNIEISAPSNVKEFDPLTPVPFGVNNTLFEGAEKAIDVPLVPDDPEVPLVPAEPDVPLDPEEPDVPLDPEVPDDPDVPLEPEEPDVPLDPGFPLGPIPPEVPLVPDDPEDPEDPTPLVPLVTPKKEVPEVPDDPLTPDVPDVPEVPTPLVPDDPLTPDVPDVPEVPTPLVPDVPLDPLDPVPVPDPEVPLVPDVPTPEGTGGVKVGDINVVLDSSKNTIDVVSKVGGISVTVG
jgi:hypothetical protein